MQQAVPVEEHAIKEENRRVRFLRFLVDLSLVSIQQEELSRDKAEKVVEDVKQAACNLFPGKEETFELIYRPRFQRVIQERFGADSGGQVPRKPRLVGGIKGHN